MEYAKNYRIFNDNWCDLPEFKDWLLPIPKDVERAYCRFCQIAIPACRKGDIRVHYESEQHKLSSIDPPNIPLEDIVFPKSDNKKDLLKLQPMVTVVKLEDDPDFQIESSLAKDTTQFFHYCSVCNMKCLSMDHIREAANTEDLTGRLLQHLKSCTLQAAAVFLSSEQRNQFLHQALISLQELVEQRTGNLPEKTRKVTFVKVENSRAAGASVKTTKPPPPKKPRPPSTRKGVKKIVSARQIVAERQAAAQAAAIAAAASLNSAESRSKEDDVQEVPSVPGSGVQPVPPVAVVEAAMARQSGEEDAGKFSVKVEMEEPSLRRAGRRKMFATEEERQAYKQAKYKERQEIKSLELQELKARGERPFECDECGMRFYQKGTLRIHKKIHLGLKEHKCKYCDRRFLQYTTCKQHEITHTGERPYVCDLCGKAYNRSSALHDHIRVHTGEKPHTCQYCGQAFRRQYYLKVHERIHTGEKPIRCDICGQAFANPGTFYSHRKRHVEDLSQEVAVSMEDFGQKVAGTIEIEIVDGDMLQEGDIIQEGSIIQQDGTIIQAADIVQHSIDQGVIQGDIVHEGEIVHAGNIHIVQEDGTIIEDGAIIPEGAIIQDGAIVYGGDGESIQVIQEGEMLQEGEIQHMSGDMAAQMVVQQDRLEQMQEGGIVQQMVVQQDEIGGQMVHDEGLAREIAKEEMNNQMGHDANMESGEEMEEHAQIVEGAVLIHNAQNQLVTSEGQLVTSDGQLVTSENQLVAEGVMTADGVVVTDQLVTSDVVVRDANEEADATDALVALGQDAINLNSL